MRFADVLPRLNRAEIPALQFITRLTNGLSCLCRLGQLHQQGVGELFVALAMINIRRNYFDRSGLVKLPNKFHRVTRPFEMSERAGGFITSVQPDSCFTAIPSFQKR